MQRYLFPFLILMIGSLSAQEVDMSIFHGMKPRNIGPAGMSGRVTDIEVVLNDVDNMNKYINTSCKTLYFTKYDTNYFSDLIMYVIC